MSSKKLSAKIFTVGCRLTKSLMAPADKIMTKVETKTAVIMIERLSTMPTAVMTESSENTMSSSKI